MDKIDERYENGKIYTIRCRYDDELIYVGSTIQKLCMRMASHRRNKTCSLYQYVNGGWDNWYIELYEEYPCNNKSCLEKREGEVIRLIGTINKCIAGRTRKEWYEDNVDEILEQQKQYRQNNRDKITEYNKQYQKNNRDKIVEKYQKNKDEILEKKKQYYKDNADKILEQRKQYQQDNADKISKYRKERIECDKCKSIVCRGDISTHKKSKKCLNYNVGNN